MKRKLHYAVVIAMAALIGACSSSQTSGDNLGGDDELPKATDAATDAVPQDMLEKPAEGDAGKQADAAPSGDQQNPEAMLSQMDNNAPAPADQAPPAQPETPPATTAAADAAPPATDISAGINNPSNGGGGGGDTYTVQQGDTLMKIAFETYGDLYKWRSIYEWNKDKIQNPNAVPTGTVLKLDKPASPVSIDRNGDKYLIKPGDTLGKISDDIYGTKTKWRKLWENNKQLIHDPNKIFAGFYLYYTVSPEERQEKEHQVAPNPMAQQPEAPAPAPQAMDQQAQAPQAPDAPPAMPPSANVADPNSRGPAGAIPGAPPAPPGN